MCIAEVRSNCLKWAMIEQLNTPPAPFATVIRKHFAIKSAAVQKVYQSNLLTVEHFIC